MGRFAGGVKDAGYCFRTRASLVAALHGFFPE